MKLIFNPFSLFVSEKKKNPKVNELFASEVKKTFECEFCANNYSNKSNLKSHIASVHEEKKPNQCNICDYTLRRQKSV